MEERICLDRPSGISQHFRPALSMRVSSPPLSHRQPNCFRMPPMACTSRMSGQSRITVSPSGSSAAAKMGNTAFFAP